MRGRVPETEYAVSGDGTHIAYQVFGEGPDLFNVPPAITNLDLRWEDPHYVAFLERMASFARVIIMDKRGCGLSDRSVEMPNIEEQTDDIAAVLDAAGSERAHLFGSLDGGVSCLLFAASHPERVEGVIPYATFATGEQTPDHPYGIDPAVVDVAVAMAESGKLSAPELVPMVAPSMVDDAEWREWYGRYTRSSVTPGSFARWLGTTRNIDIRSILSTISVPVLVLNRTGDRMISVETARDLAERIPGARFVELPGDDYMYWVGETEPLLDEIEEFVTGRPATPVDANRVLATVLFTDIVDSTRRAAELGDAEWKRVLDRHDLVVETEVRRHRGQLVKATGDGALATFDGPARGVRCGQAIASAVRPLGLEIRAGVHTGEVELRGADVGGIGVHIAARVQSVASAGEIMVSRTVTELVVGSGLTFEDRGEHELKGVPGSWQLYAALG